MGAYLTLTWLVFQVRPLHGSPREGCGSLSMQPVGCTPWCSTVTATDVAKGVTTVYSIQRLQIMDVFFEALLTWISIELAGDSIIKGIIKGIICEKAQQIYNDLLMKTPSTIGGESGLVLKAVEAGLKILCTEVKSRVLVGWERISVQRGKRLKNLMTNFVCSTMQKVISPNKSLAVTSQAYFLKKTLHH